MSPPLIVLIEDNPGDVYLVQMALQQAAFAHTLQQFESGADALRELCPSCGEPGVSPDAILLDLKTPRSDGFDVLMKLRQTPRLVQVPIAILTSSRSPSDKHRASLHGARYVEKPVQLAEFLDTVGQAIKAMLAEADRAS